MQPVHVHPSVLSRRGLTGRRSWLLVIRCNPMIMRDYDTLALTWRSRTETPVIQRAHTRRGPAVSPPPPPPPGPYGFYL